MSLLASGSITALPDYPGGAETFACYGADRIDITALGFDVRLEVMAANGHWDDEQRIRGGLHRSFPGLSEIYKQVGGVGGFRLSNWTPGAVASCDYEAA